MEEEDEGYDMRVCLHLQGSNRVVPPESAYSFLARRSKRTGS
jgi:hypothetical protein